MYHSAKSRIITVVLLAGVLPCLTSLAAHLLFGDTPYVQEPLHESFELAGGCIALGVAMLLLLRLRRDHTSPHLLWVAAALVAMGVVDMMHAVAHFGDEWSWLRHWATFVGGVVSGLTWLPLPTTRSRGRQVFVLLVIGLAVSGSVTVWMRSDWLPAPWGPQGYTLAPKVVNALGGLGFLSAALFFGRRYLRHTLTEDLVLGSYVLLFGAASVLFAFSQVWTAGWWVWHAARLVAYVIVLVFAYGMVAALHQQIARHAQELQDRVQARTAELREREEITRSAFANAAIGFAMTTPDGRFVDANPAYCRLTGYGVEELRALRFPELIHPEDRAENMKLIERLLGGQLADFTVENRYVRKGGEPLWVRKSVSLVRGPQGSPQWVLALIEDITERKRAEEALRESEARLRHAQASAGAGIWTWDISTGKLAWSEELFRLFGLDSTAVDASFDLWTSVLHPEDRQPAEERIQTAIANRTPLASEYRIVLPSGEVRWVDALGNTTYDGAGTPLRMSGICIDITDRKRTEEQLRQSREDLDRAQEVGQIGWWRLDVRRNVLTWSDENHRIFGVPKGTPLSYETFLGIVHPDDRAYVDTKWNTGLRGEPYDIEHRIVADGQIKWVRERAYLEFDPEGALLGGFGITQDITARKTAEEELRRSEEERIVARAVRAERQRLFDVLETLPAMICLLTPDHRATFANRSFRERFGESKGRRCYEWCFGRTEPCDFCESFRVFETGRPHRWEIGNPDGTVIDSHVLPFTDHDGSPMILEMSLDITERRRAEEELRFAHESLSARAAQLRALTGELARSEQRERRRLARILHDHLQQLLIAARFRTAILSRMGDELTRQAVAEIEHLLDESITAGRLLTAELSPPILHDAGLPAGLEWLARWMADTHGLHVNLVIDEALPPLQEEVKVLLFESVRELLFNAVKHARVASATVNVRRLGSEEIRITVSDNGPGFDPGAPKRTGEAGRGFGLFTIRERLELLGGRMDIDSAPGRGSRFTLTASVGQPTETAPPVVASPPHPADGARAVPAGSPTAGKPLRVLIADDHAVVREGLRRLLDQEPDIQIAGEAADGEEAVEMAGSLRPDVILMDLSMPKLNGVDATRTVHHAHPDIRIIGLSMFADSDLAKSMRDAGAVDYLTKSGPPLDLVAAIRRACQPPADLQHPPA